MTGHTDKVNTVDTESTTTLETDMKVTRINDTQLAITLPTGRAFTIGRMDGLNRITFEEKDDLDGFWRLLLENADELGATTGPKTAELEMLSNRIDALETNEEELRKLQEYTKSLDRRDHVHNRNHGALIEELKEAIDGIKHDIEAHGRQLEDLEDAAETAEPATIDDDQLHDAIATYVMGKPNVLRRAILDTITDKLC